MSKLYSVYWVFFAIFLNSESENPQICDFSDTVIKHVVTKNRSPNLTASPNCLDIAWKSLIRNFVWFLLKNIFQTVNLGLWFQRQSKWREICLVFIVLFMVSSNFQFGTLFSTLFRTSIKFSTIVHCNPVTISLIQDYFFILYLSSFEMVPLIRHGVNEV